MAKKSTLHKELILAYLERHPQASSSAILEGIGGGISVATLKRILQDLVATGQVESTGTFKGRKYQLNSHYLLNRPVDLNIYFEQEAEYRAGKIGFDYELIPGTLRNLSIFTPEEYVELTALQQVFRKNTEGISRAHYNHEMERLAIDLSWKSSQIEGNTYSLLETERLIKEKITAQGKTAAEAAMLLNHKEAIDFILDHPDYLYPLSVSRIEDLHRILVKGLDISHQIRTGRVGITGTNYTPPNNQFQIIEALESMCSLINEKESVFDKALLALLLISYIQPFFDGNKRTARLVSNAILIHHRYCPLSFRSVDSLEYKKNLLIFYEQSNLHPFKKMFMDQFKFAVQTYF